MLAGELAKGSRQSMQTLRGDGSVWFKSPKLVRWPLTSDAWFSAAKRRTAGDSAVRFCAAAASTAAGAVLPRHVSPAGQAGAPADRGGLPAVVAAPGPGPALPARGGTVGESAGRGGSAVAGGHRRTSGGRLPAGEWAGSGP